MRNQSRRLVLAVTAVAFFFLACNKTLEAPPVEVEYRDSLLGIGKIVRVTNQHSEALTNLVIRIENPNHDIKHHTLASLPVGETYELGWKKLDGFQVEVGAEVTIRSEGFIIPHKVQLQATSEE